MLKADTVDVGRTVSQERSHRSSAPKEYGVPLRNRRVADGA